MAEVINSKDDTLAPPSALNWFDPKVIFDPKGEISGPAAEPFERPNDDLMFEKGKKAYNTDSTKWYGKYTPIIMYNTNILDYRYIKKMILHYDAFTPYLTLMLDDYDNSIGFSDIPGFDNVVTVMLLPHTDLKWKAIKLNFYIKDIQYHNTCIFCQCELKYMSLEKNHTEQLWFHWPAPGCPTDHVTGVSSGDERNSGNNNIVDCPLPPNKHPNTYELLHVIAENTGLGFAATDQCSGIRDDKHRFLRHEKYRDTIQTHVNFAGLDENSIFDTFIDVYGYINMINLPWVMSQNINYDNIGIYAETGFGHTNPELPENELTPGMVHRIFTNSNLPIVHNMYLTSFEYIVDNERMMEHGSLSTYVDLFPKGVDQEGNNQEKNNIHPKSIQMIENSFDGEANANKYIFENNYYRGSEMGTDADNNHPTNHQKCIHDKYFRRLRARRIKVRLQYPNYGVLRGTIIGIVWVEYNLHKKNAIVKNNPNTRKPDTSTVNATTDDELYDNVLHEGTPVLDEAKSGLYYVDGMEFVWNQENVNFDQYLILIKKDGNGELDRIRKFFNHTTKSKWQK